jgi:uncharacterized protein (DUF433 family)
MPLSKELEKQLRELDPRQRAEAFSILSEGGPVPAAGQLSARDSLPFQPYPSIVRTPGVCGGAARLIRTRIPVWALERMRQLGVSESDMLRSYPNVCTADLVQAWAYVERNREEIGQAILENEEA